ncbi:MAG: hypothetical protein AB7U38_10820 [Hyphomicrobiales bacterium]
MITNDPVIRLQPADAETGASNAADVFPPADATEPAAPGTPGEMLAMVDDTVDTLLRRGVTPEDLAPLRRLRRAIAHMDTAARHAEAGHEAPAAGPPAKDMRNGQGTAGSDLLARTGAVIELLIQGGYTAETAAQVIARQMLASGIHMPEGGDARGWKRLLLWHSRLVHSRKRGPDYEEYLRFKAELNAIPPEQRIQAALAGRLWDRRRLQEFIRRPA